MEMETLISIDYEEKTLNIYTTYPTLARRMKKKGYEPTKVFYMDDEEDGWEWNFGIEEIGKFLRSGFFKVGTQMRNTVKVLTDEEPDEEEVAS